MKREELKTMKKMLALFLCVCTAAVSMSACSPANEFSGDENLSDNTTRDDDIEKTYNYQDGAQSGPLSYTTYSSEVTDFELRLFRNYIKNNPDTESFVFSPMSTALTLGIIANGAADRTQTNIINALGDELDIDATNQSSSYLLSRLEAFNTSEDETEEETKNSDEDSKGKSYVKIQNTLLFNDTVDVRKNFLQNNTDYYGADIFRFVFSDENSITKVNNHLSEFTSKKAVSSLDAENNLICIGAVDIYDEWLNSYAQSDVSSGVFHSSDGDCDVNYMTSNENYIHTETASGIIKYTSGTPLKFIAVMPNEDISLESYISSLTYLEYTDLLESFSVQSTVSASVPEFSIEGSETAVSFKDELSECGIADIFTDEVSLSNITLSDSLYVNDISQILPSITVNAAGISGTESVGTKAPVQTRTEEITPAETKLEFNRPFIFMLIDNESNIPVYIGTVDL